MIKSISRVVLLSSILLTNSVYSAQASSKTERSTCKKLSTPAVGRTGNIEDLRRTLTKELEHLRAEAEYAGPMFAILVRTKSHYWGASGLRSIDAPGEYSDEDYNDALKDAGKLISDPAYFNLTGGAEGADVFIVEFGSDSIGPKQIEFLNTLAKELSSKRMPINTISTVVIAPEQGDSASYRIRSLAIGIGSHIRDVTSQFDPLEERVNVYQKTQHH